AVPRAAIIQRAPLRAKRTADFAAISNPLASTLGPAPAPPSTDTPRQPIVQASSRRSRLGQAAVHIRLYGPTAASGDGALSTTAPILAAFIGQAIASGSWTVTAPAVTVLAGEGGPVANAPRQAITQPPPRRANRPIVVNYSLNLSVAQTISPGT